MLFRHRTTRKRAEGIQLRGPDADFREPDGERAEGFSVAPGGGPFDLGDPEDYARRKANLFPNEDGPAILQFDLPDVILENIVGGVGKLEEGKAFNAGSEVRFEPGGGLEQLLDGWRELTRQVILWEDRDQ